MLNKILQRVGWFGLLFALGFLFIVTFNLKIADSHFTLTDLKDLKNWANSEQWQAIENAGLNHCVLWADVSYNEEQRIGTKSAMVLNTRIDCADGKVIDTDIQLLLRLQGPIKGVQPIGEIRTPPGNTVWTVTGIDHQAWQGTLRVDLLVSDQQISLLAYPIDIKSVRFIGMDQTGVIILTVFLFVIPMACLMIVEWRKKVPEPAGSSPK